MLALLRFALNSSIFVDHNEFLDELTLLAMVRLHPGLTSKQFIIFGQHR